MLDFVHSGKGPLEVLKIVEVALDFVEFLEDRFNRLILGVLDIVLVQVIKELLSLLLFSKLRFRDESLWF